MKGQPSTRLLHQVSERLMRTHLVLLVAAITLCGGLTYLWWMDRAEEPAVVPVPAGAGVPFPAAVSGSATSARGSGPSEAPSDRPGAGEGGAEGGSDGGGSSQGAENVLAIRYCHGAWGRFRGCTRDRLQGQDAEFWRSLGVELQERCGQLSRELTLAEVQTVVDFGFTQLAAQIHVQTSDYGRGRLTRDLKVESLARNFQRLIRLKASGLLRDREEHTPK